MSPLILMWVIIIVISGVISPLMWVIVIVISGVISPLMWVIVIVISGVISPLMWVIVIVIVISGVISPLMWVIIIVTILITLLRAIHEPPSSVREAGFGLLRFQSQHAHLLHSEARPGHFWGLGFRGLGFRV